MNMFKSENGRKGKEREDTDFENKMKKHQGFLITCYEMLLFERKESK